MNIVQFQGGLGNQLFQYAAGLYSSEKDPFKADCTYYSLVKARHFILNELGISISPISPYTNPFEAMLNLPVLDGYWKPVYPLLRRYTLFPEKKQFTFDRSLKDLHESYISGYWQHRSYVDEVEDLLRSQITFTPEIKRRNKKTVSLMKNTTSVSLHVRRGDYLKNTTFPLTPLSYYDQSTKIMRRRNKKAHFFVFSDDINWCKKEFNQLKSVTFIDRTTSEVDDLYLMSQCIHHILGNSTFSWWGAWLAKSFHTNAINIAPKKWSADPLASEALMYKHWKKL